MEIRRFIPGEEYELSRMTRRTLLEYNSQNTTPEEEHWIPWLANKYSPETIRDYADKGHTYVLCNGKTLLGMGGVMLTGERECTIYGLFLAPEVIGKGLGTAMFRVLEQDVLYKRADRAWLVPTTAAMDFYEKKGYTYMDGYRVRRPGEGVHFMEKFLHRED